MSNILGPIIDISKIKTITASSFMIFFIKSILANRVRKIKFLNLGHKKKNLSF